VHSPPSDGEPYVPGLQKTQTVLLGELCEPGGQTSQTEMLMAPITLLTVPGGHGRQAERPVALA